MKKLATVAIGALTGAGVLMAWPAAMASATSGTQAAAGPQAQAAARATTAPACIGRAIYNNDPTDLSNTYVILTNNCGTSKRVRVLFNAGADSACRTIAAGGTSRASSLSVFGTYDKTVLC